MFRRNRDQHVHMVRHHVSFLDPAVLMLSKVMKHFTEVFPKLTIEDATAAFRNENHVIFALPFGVT